MASLPCYLKENVDGKRGKCVYDASIRALMKLNFLGYGKNKSGLVINSMYNPSGPHLPPDQQKLENDYRRELKIRYQIEFNHLLTLTNMPIMRFGSTLVSKETFDDYMNFLKNAHRDSNLKTLMCISLISVDYRGHVYDCDFNQMLDLPLKNEYKNAYHISELNAGDLPGKEITVGGHYYGCTAGQGSSCGGALS